MAANTLVQAPVQSPANPMARIDELCNELRAALIPYITSSPDNRDTLVDLYGRPLLKLNGLVHTLTRSRMEREYLIVAQQLFLDIEQQGEEKAER